MSTKGNEFAAIRAFCVNPLHLIRRRTSAWPSATFAASDAEKEFIRVYPCASVVNDFLSASNAAFDLNSTGLCLELDFGVIDIQRCFDSVACRRLKLRKHASELVQA